ncbi:MAG TPA: 4-(cytidine 5'-diphospho)-2-C-methyl-D-erythritol kinase, partial [Sphingorhabdus sp.]|nr:4-(cytidine 5'-diphospho)-2-C-methyl-D-erythritol kinase [Sphingorhabdus sp.]
SETAYAKINLALHVRRRRDDGYHDIETLFAFADGGDGLSAELADDISLYVTGPFAEGLSGTDNLVVRAAHLMQRRFSVRQGAAIHLDKRLPVASGIGGGSADAAATARLLNRLWNVGADDSELEALLAPLGADIPACVRSQTVYGEGTGTELRDVDGAAVRGRPLLLVNPSKGVATGPVFRAWDDLDRGPLGVVDPWGATLAGRNDLQSPAISICPEIGDVLAHLARSDADLVRMSGSGATCFALYSSETVRDAADMHIRRTCPEWWTMASSIR